MTDLAALSALKNELNARRPLTRGELERLREQFTIEYTYDSNAIEGNSLTLRETALVLSGVTIGEKPLRDHLAAIGHRDAFQYIESLIHDGVPLTERTIKEIHSLVLMNRPEDKGRYRRVPVVISGASFTPPDPLFIPEQIVTLLNDFDSSAAHPIEAAALFHLRFERIHPFIDGNGRTGRLLLNFQLMKSGYTPIDVKYQDRRRYYDELDTFDREGNAAPMIGLIADYVEERLLDFLSLTESRK